jgi:adenylylsulfate kinase
MLFIQLTGLSGSGKSTIANGVKKLLESNGFRVEVIDGDIYRKKLCPDLGFSKEDRHEIIRRL